MLDLPKAIKENTERLILEIGESKPHHDLLKIALEILTNTIKLEAELKNKLEDETRLTRQNIQRNQKHKGGLAHVLTISRVEKKLKLWVDRPHQTNHKILKEYLKLRQKGITNISEGMLCDKVTEDGSIGVNQFHTNFAQMKTDSPKSHGKIFETIGKSVEIWDPVAEYVGIFKAKVLGQ